MKRFDPAAAAANAVAARATAPATAIVHDSADVRMIVFRLEPGQQVAPHTSTSTVVLHVLEGEGVVQGGTDEDTVSAGTVITYEPNELHGMRALTDRFVLLATITPRPGTR